MPDREVNADIIRNRLASFAAEPANAPTRQSCPHCGGTVSTDKNFCSFCGASSSPPADENYRVATASPELTASQKPYDPYQHVVPPYAVPVADDLSDEAEDSVEPELSSTSREDSEEDDPEPSRRNYQRAALAGLAVGVLGLAAMSGWHWRGQIREMSSEFNRRLPSEVAAFKGETDTPRTDGPAPVQTTKEVRKHPGAQRLPSHSAQGVAPAVPRNAGHSEPATLMLASEAGRSAGGLRPALVGAAVSPMRVTITPRESLQLLMFSVPPVYSQQARDRRLEGSVALKAVIGKDGTVLGLQVVSGDALLVPAAMEAVKQWRYRPYFLNGEPREVETTVIVDFSLARERADNQ